MGKRVEIHGTSRADLNGTRGIATDFQPADLLSLSSLDEMLARSRYTVQLDNGETFRLKLLNVRAEGTGGAGAGSGSGSGSGAGAGSGPGPGSGAGRAKGKGKKGRRK